MNMFTGYIGNMGNVNIIFSEFAARYGTKEYPTKVNDYTIAIHEQDKQLFLDAIENINKAEVCK